MLSIFLAVYLLYIGVTWQPHDYHSHELWFEQYKHLLRTDKHWKMPAGIPPTDNPWFRCHVGRPEAAPPGMLECYEHHKWYRRVPREYFTEWPCYIRIRLGGYNEVCNVCGEKAAKYQSCDIALLKKDFGIRLKHWELVAVYQHEKGGQHHVTIDNLRSQHREVLQMDCKRVWCGVLTRLT